MGYTNDISVQVFFFFPHLKSFARIMINDNMKQNVKWKERDDRWKLNFVISIIRERRFEGRGG